MKQLFINENGSLVVEYALILPLLLVTLFGTIELSMFLMNRQTLTYACNEGARVGILKKMSSSPVSVEDDIKNTIEGIIYNGITGNAQASGEINIDRNNDQNGDGIVGSSGDLLTVSLTYNHTFIILSNLSFIIPEWDGTISIKAVATRRIE